MPTRTVLLVLPVVTIPLPLAQQARTPQDQLHVLRVVPTHTVLPVPPVVTILLPLVQQAHMPRAQLRVLRVVPTHTVLLVNPVVTILQPLAQQARTPREQLHVQPVLLLPTLPPSLVHLIRTVLLPLAILEDGSTLVDALPVNQSRTALRRMPSHVPAQLRHV